MKRTQTTSRALLLAALMAAAMSAAPVHAQINFTITIAPPAPEYEVVPVIPQGYVWAPGYWGWNGDRHIWVHGRPIAQRAGYRWVPDRWEQRDQRYYRSQGRWERDSSYREVKVKKEKKPKKWENDNDEHGNSGKHGKNRKGD